MELIKRTIETLSSEDLKNKLVQENNFELDENNSIIPSQREEYLKKLSEKRTFNIQFFLTQNIKDLGIYNDIINEDIK
jgi:hypothetical protein